MCAVWGAEMICALKNSCMDADAASALVYMLGGRYTSLQAWKQSYLSYK